MMKFILRDFQITILLFFAISSTTQAQEEPMELVIQLGHSKSVSSVAFSPDGRYALSGSGDETLQLWDVANGREIWRF